MLIAVYLLPCALHPSAIDKTADRGEEEEEEAEGGGRDISEEVSGARRRRRTGRHASALDEGTVSSARRLFDIVTVEGEGCSAAGWEEMRRRSSGGGGGGGGGRHTERI